MMSWLKALNRRRLFWKRLRVVKKDDLPQRNPLTRPERVQRLLVIDAFPGFGDAVYTNGLLSALARDGLEVSVAAREKMLSVFRTNGALKATYSLESEADREACLAESFDMVVDLDYNHTHTFPLRMPWLKALRACTATCSEYGRELNVFHDFIDISRFAHVGERLGLVRAYVLGSEDVEPIRPVFDVPEHAPLEFRAVYVNTLASQDDRCLSADQIAQLAAWFRKERKLCGLFYVSDDVELEEDAWVRRIRPDSFGEAASLLKETVAVITPDTSMVHVAAAFEKPVLALFCGKERDYFPAYAMSETWAPRSEKAMVVKPDESLPGKVVPVSAISSSALEDGLRWLGDVVEEKAS